jgi:hypothetical protein
VNIVEHTRLWNVEHTRLWNVMRFALLFVFSLSCEVVNITNFYKHWTICVWTLDFVAFKYNV